MALVLLTVKSECYTQLHTSVYGINTLVIHMLYTKEVYN
jgi:hypothetical protein